VVKRLFGVFRTRLPITTSVAVALLVAPLAAEAQQTAKTYRVGVIHSSPIQSTSLAFRALRERLRELGYVEGQNCTFELRGSARPEDLPSLAADLVAARVDVIVAGDPSTAAVAKRATSKIPIVVTVFAVDPVAAGLVESLARPGRNVTGLTFFAPEMSGKRLELLKEIIPRLSRVAALWSSHAVQHPSLLQETDDAARRLGIAVARVEANGADDIARAFQTAVKKRVSAMVILQAAEFARINPQIAELGLKHQLPTVSGEDGFAEGGGLIKYGPSWMENWRRAGDYVAKILKGANPADLPVEQPTKFELVINMKTAKALRLMIPPSLLLRADQVIE